MSGFSWNFGRRSSRPVRSRWERKQGAAYGYTKVLGYHPILATRADTREGRSGYRWARQRAERAAAARARPLRLV
jgi:hypothetical protein